MDVLIVSGLSGAGRSTALNALEDLGYFCVDNLPPAAFRRTLEACAADQLPRIALGIDVRIRSFLSEALAEIESLRAEYGAKILYLDASTQALQTRFSSTRRPHPLRAATESGTSPLRVTEGIAKERQQLGGLRAQASVVIDTTELTVHTLRRRVVDLFDAGGDKSSGLQARFVSFGFKYSTPTDCDSMFDVRFIENPYFIRELRPYSGMDPPIVDFVRSREAATQFCNHVTELLAFALPQYEEEGRSYLTVGFGCTGGRHRSVAMAEWVAERLRERVGIQIRVAHRDAGRVNQEQALERRSAPPLGDVAQTAAREPSNLEASKPAIKETT